MRDDSFSKFLVGEWAPTPLKPCPFCGKDDAHVAPLGNGAGSVGCNSCGADGPSARTLTLAIHKWNERNLPDAPVTEISHEA